TTSAQGPCYRFTVDSADQAASIIRDRLGPRAHVLSVRTIEASGLRRLWASPRLEVVAQVEPEDGGADSGGAVPAQDEAADESLPKIAPASPPSLPSLLRRSGVSEIALGRLQCDPA